MCFVKNREITHLVRGGGRGMVIFRYVTHPFYLNTFETTEKMKPDNYD